MSGPKSYSPPPYVSKDWLEQSLRGVFSLQASIRRLSTEVKDLAVHDQKRNINFSCPSYTNECETALRPFLDTSVPILLSTFNSRIQPEINKKVETLKNLHNKLQEAKYDFLNKQADYENYVEFEFHYVQTSMLLTDMIQSSKAYVNKYLSDQSTELCETIDSFQLLDTIPNFQFGFSKELKPKKQHLNQLFNELQEKLRIIRYSAKGNEAPKKDRLLTEAAKKLVAEIKSNLQGVSNAEERSRLESRLETLLSSTVSIDEYFFSELNEETTRAISSQEQKKAIKSLTRLLNEAPCHSSTEDMRLKIAQEISLLLSINVLKKRQIVSLEDRLTEYIQNTTLAVELEEARTRENQYIRSQIMLGLNALGYELAEEETELLDFTKGRDYTLRVPGQDNFIRIAFSENGSFVYNFMIPEDRSNLSIEATQLKLKEMESSCQLFNKVVSNLIDQGVDLKLNKEQAVEERFLLQVPERYQKAPKKTARRKAEEEQLKVRQRGAQ